MRALLVTRVHGVALALSLVAAEASPAEPRREAEAEVARPSSAAALRSVESFASIADAAARSAALFTEAGKVLLHPRCVNCHPASDRPLQGEDGRPHEPRVRRGEEGMGVVGMRCLACHGAANYDEVGLPGHPQWHLAPTSMAWEGLTLRQLCEQVKDPDRNGGRTLEQVVEHMSSDPLVGWAWAPGARRTAAPGTQAGFGALIEAWAGSGAVCPPSGTGRRER